jgi:hypothetical protein
MFAFSYHILAGITPGEVQDSYSLESKYKFSDILSLPFPPFSFSEFPILKCWAQSEVAAPCALKSEEICQWKSMQYKSVRRFTLLSNSAASFQSLSAVFKVLARF